MFTAMFTSSAQTCRSKVVHERGGHSSTDSYRGTPGQRAGESGVEKDEERNIGPMITLEN